MLHGPLVWALKGVPPAQYTPYIPYTVYKLGAHASERLKGGNILRADETTLRLGLLWAAPTALHGVLPWTFRVVPLGLGV